MKPYDKEQIAKHKKMIKDATNKKRSSSGDKLIGLMAEGGKKIKHAVQRRRRKSKQSNKRSPNKRSNMDEMNGSYDQNLNAFNKLSNQYSSSSRRRRSLHARRNAIYGGSILTQYIPINGYYPTEQLTIYDDYFNHTPNKSSNNTI